MDHKDTSADAQALIASTRAQPRWAKWSNVPRATVEELVLLSLGIDPDVWRDEMTPREQHMVAYAVGLNQKLDLAVRSLSSEGPLRPTPEGARGKKARVDAAVFVNWAQTVNPRWLLPPEFPTGGTASIVRGIESLNTPHHPYYAEELAIACRAWLALYSEGHEKAAQLNKGDRERFATDAGAGSVAADRIATLINPFSRKSGGVSKTPVKKTDHT